MPAVTSTCSTPATGFTEVPRSCRTLRDAVHAMDVGFAELTAVGVDGQPPAHLDRAVGDEVFRFALAAESQLLQLNQVNGVKWS